MLQTWCLTHVSSTIKGPLLSRAVRKDTQRPIRMSQCGCSIMTTYEQACSAHLLPSLGFQLRGNGSEGALERVLHAVKLALDPEHLAEVALPNACNLLKLLPAQRHHSLLTRVRHQGCWAMGAHMRLPLGICFIRSSWDRRRPILHQDLHSILGGKHL